MVSIPGDGGKCALFSGIFGMAASFEFLKRIISEKIQEDNYAYENNGRSCRGKYEYEAVEYTFSVYKDAERRGDTAVMERAMGYAANLQIKRRTIKRRQKKGMKEDAKGSKGKSEDGAGKRHQEAQGEREEQEKRIAESRNEDTDTVSVKRKWKGRIGREDRIRFRLALLRKCCGSY